MGMRTVEYYKLGDKFCGHHYRNSAACVFVHESTDFDSVSTHHICEERVLEICAAK